MRAWSNKFPRSGCCWLAVPGAHLSGTTHLTRPEYTCALRLLRILRSPASCLGRRRSTRMEGCVVWCHCNRRVSLTTDPMHAYTSCSSEGQFIRRHNHICDAIHDQLAKFTRIATGGRFVEFFREPLLARSLPAPSTEGRLRLGVAIAR